jgi:peptidoglycan hydrolase-like protein with peptidoglycan-binding domain
MDRLRSEIAADLASRGLPTKAEELSANRLPTLRKGYIGEETKYLQKLLGITADGKFGANTESAVKKFQKSKNLSADGVCGNRTWAALVTDVDPEPMPEPTPVPVPDPTPEPDDETELVEMTLAEALEVRAILRKALEIVEKAIESR